jgi:hypothetical protein
MLAGAALSAVSICGIASASESWPISSGVEQVGEDHGGLVADYVGRVEHLRGNKHKVAFSGMCGSACTLLLSLPADQLCVMRGASFVFHTPSAPSASGAEAARAYLMSRYPRWVRQWIASQGGLSSAPITMDADYSRRHLKACG